VKFCLLRFLHDLDSQARWKPDERGGYSAVSKAARMKSAQDELFASQGVELTDASIVGNERVFVCSLSTRAATRFRCYRVY